MPLHTWFFLTPFTMTRMCCLYSMVLYSGLGVLSVVAPDLLLASRSRLSVSPPSSRRNAHVQDLLSTISFVEPMSFPLYPWYWIAPVFTDYPSTDQSLFFFLINWGLLTAFFTQKSIWPPLPMAFPGDAFVIFTLRLILDHSFSPVLLAEWRPSGLIQSLLFQASPLAPSV